MPTAVVLAAGAWGRHTDALAVTAVLVGGAAVPAATAILPVLVGGHAVASTVALAVVAGVAQLTGAAPRWVVVELQLGVF